VGTATAAAAEDKNASDPPPSLEYRPPRVVTPEPRAPSPAPPVTIFREAVGSFGMVTGSFNGPVDVARDESGLFYVLDSGNSRVQVFDHFSNFVLSTGSYGSRDVKSGEFNKPQAIAVDGRGFIYVVDTGNNRIQKFGWSRNCISECPSCPVRTDGMCLLQLKTWGSLGSREGYFKSPRDITFDRDGNIYVLDAGNDRVQKFDSSERFIGEWGRFFNSKGGIFTDLVSIAWSRDRSGYIFLLGKGCLVQQLDFDWNLVASWPAVAPESGLCVPARIEIDRKNNYVYVLDSGNSLLICINPAVGGMYRWALRGAQAPFSKPLGLSVNPDGDEVLVADTENNIVQKFTLR
jgi:DNA-binding beta-propeller fold protein YncE